MWFVMCLILDFLLFHVHKHSCPMLDISIWTQERVYKTWNFNNSICGRNNRISILRFISFYGKKKMKISQKRFDGAYFFAHLKRCMFTVVSLHVSNGGLIWLKTHKQQPGDEWFSGRENFLTEDPRRRLVKVEFIYEKSSLDLCWFSCHV